MVSCKDIYDLIEKNDSKYFDGRCRLDYAINSANYKGRTFLSHAVRKANLQTIIQIIKKGASIEQRETGGATPLLLAVYLGRFEVVEYLVKYGCNVHVEDSYDSPLMLAVRKGHFDIAKLLLDNGADVDIVNINDVSPLSWAIKENKIELVELLLSKRVPNDIENASGDSLLVSAVRNRSSIDIVQCLLKHGEEVNTSRNERTPLAWAAAVGSLEIVKLLLANGANINLLGSDGNSPLAAAVEHKQTEVVKYLIQMGANVCKVGDTGKTPLLWAVQNEDCEMVKYLLDHGALYIIDTVFLDAIETKNLEVVQLLLEQGASPSEEYIEEDSDDQITPLMKALDIESTDIASCLIENGAKVVDDLDKNEISYIISLLVNNNIEMVKLLVEKGARIDETGDCGETLLTKSIQLENFEMVKYFLAHNADVNRPNKNQLTPMAIAASNNDFRTFQYLVDCGGDIKELSTGEDQSLYRKLTRYYEVTKQNKLKRGQAGLAAASNQEAADTV